MTKKSSNVILTMLAYISKRGYYLLFLVLLACQPQTPISNGANGEKVTQNSKNDSFVTNPPRRSASWRRASAPTPRWTRVVVI